MNTLISIVTGAMIVAVSVVCLAGLLQAEVTTARNIQSIISVH